MKQDLHARARVVARVAPLTLPVCACVRTCARQQLIAAAHRALARMTGSRRRKNRSLLRPATVRARADSSLAATHICVTIFLQLRARANVIRGSFARDVSAVQPSAIIDRQWIDFCARYASQGRMRAHRTLDWPRGRANRMRVCQHTQVNSLALASASASGTARAAACDANHAQRIEMSSRARS